LARGMAGFVDSSIPGFVARCSPCDRIGVLAISPPTPPASTPRCRSSARVSASYPSTKTRFPPPRPAHTLPSNLAALAPSRPPAIVTQRGTWSSARRQITHDTAVSPARLASRLQSQWPPQALLPPRLWTPLRPPSASMPPTVHMPTRNPTPTRCSQCSTICSTS
jgi:hypothetical protein